MFNVSFKGKLPKSYFPSGRATKAFTPLPLFAAGATSQCYWDKLMLLKFELMLSKCQINTNTNNYGFLLPTKCLEGVLKYSYLVSITSKLRIFKVKFVTFTSIISNKEWVSEKLFFALNKNKRDDVIILSILDYFINY